MSQFADIKNEDDEVFQSFPVQGMRIENEDDQMEDPSSNYQSYSENPYESRPSTSPYASSPY